MSQVVISSRHHCDVIPHFHEPLKCRVPRTVNYYWSYLDCLLFLSGLPPPLLPAFEHISPTSRCWIGVTCLVCTVTSFERAMSDSTFHTTREDIRKAESKLSQSNNGTIPASSEVAQMKVGSAFFSEALPRKHSRPVMHAKSSVVNRRSKPREVEERAD